MQIGFGGQLSDFRRDRNTLNATTEKLLETGATFTLGFILEQQFLDPSPFAFFNPFATSSIEAKVTQPLLKNAGIFYNRSNIYIARNDKKRSILELKETAIDVINSAQKAYWELVKAIEELRGEKEIFRKSRGLTEEEQRFRSRLEPWLPIELLVAEEGVARQLEGVVVAENDIKDREDDLKQVMNLSNNAVLSDVSIVPLDRASFQVRDVSIEESIKIALENRPEVFEQGLDIENTRIKVKQQKNQLLPRLDFEAGIRYDGLAANKGNAIDSAFSQDFQSEFLELHWRFL